MASSADLDESVRRWSTFDWVAFTSTNGVEMVAARARALGVSLSASNVRIAAVGPATSEAAESAGLTVHAVPDEYVTDALADVLGDVRGLRVLLPRSRLARKSLADELRRRGADVHDVPAYDAVPAEPDLQALRREPRVDFIVFTSASAVRNFATIVPEADWSRLRRTARVVCIGPVAAEMAREVGLRVAAVAREHSVPGIVATLQAEVNARG
jgi:uroporphyrinogen III methyltransferase/synthase